MFGDHHNCQTLLISCDPQGLQPQYIPILVTKKRSENHQKYLKVSPHVLVDRRASFKDKERGERDIKSHQQPRNQSIQGEEQSIGPVMRTRRISSSTVSKRFPKGFFLVEGKSRASQPKKTNQFPNLLDTFSLKCLPFRSQQEQSSSSFNCQQTPQFKKKEATKQLRRVEQFSSKQIQPEIPPKLSKFTSLKEKISLQTLAEPRDPLREGLHQLGMNNLAVTLGDKIKNAKIARKERQKKRIQSLRQLVDKGENIYRDTHMASKKDGDFRIRRTGVL